MWIRQVAGSSTGIVPGGHARSGVGWNGSGGGGEGKGVGVAQLAAPSLGVQAQWSDRQMWRQRGGGCWRSRALPISGAASAGEVRWHAAAGGETEGALQLAVWDPSRLQKEIPGGLHMGSHEGTGRDPRRVLVGIPGGLRLRSQEVTGREGIPERPGRVGYGSRRRDARPTNEGRRAHASLPLQQAEIGWLRGRGSEQDRSRIPSPKT